LRGPVIDERLLPLRANVLEKEGTSPSWIDSKIISMDHDSYVLKDIYTLFLGRGEQRFQSQVMKLMLSQYCVAYGQREISIRAFVWAFIEQAAENWGWSEEVFYGDPRGEQPGEKLGYDIAVSRHYRPATHGRQSSIASPAEKYTWLAVNRVTGYLSDRLRLAESGDYAFDLSGFGSGLPSVDPKDALLVDPRDALLLDPRDALYDPATALRRLNPPAGWGPVLPQGDGSQAKEAMRWQQKAPVPDDAHVRAWLIDNDDGWLTLQRSFFDAEPASLCEVIIQIGSVIADPSDIKRFKDATHGIGFATYHTSIRAGGFYVPPTLAVWAPWIRDEQEDAREYAVADVYFEEVDGDGAGHERSAWLPNERFRRALYTSRLSMRSAEDGDQREVRYFDRDGREVGRYDQRRTRFFREYDELLAVHPDALTALKDQVLVWHIRMIREPAGYLFSDGTDRPEQRVVDWVASIDASGAFKICRIP